MPYVINQELCSGCHRCRIECPAGAVRFKNAKYWIDPDKCISCGHCVTVCHNDVISNPEEKKQPVPHDPISLKCDVLVIGGGASGLTAAAYAAEQGRDVLVLEKNKEIGGSAWYAHVLRTPYSKWHEQAGMKNPVEDLYREFMDRTEGHVNGKLVRRILDADVDFVNWMIEKHDLGRDYKFDKLFWGGYGPSMTTEWDLNRKRIDTTIGPGGTGWYMTNRLLGILQDHGGRIRYRTRAVRLLTDPEGRVTGAEAEDEGGNLTVSCKACVIAAGAMSRNKELTNKFNPIFYQEDAGEPVHVFTCATCTGDGILMCEDIGADIDYHNARVGMLGPMRHPFGTASIAAGISQYGVKVTQEGKVFTGEFFSEAICPLAYEPGRILWNIIDEASVERTMQESMGKKPDVPGICMDRFYENWRFELDQEISWGTMYRADTLHELAALTGVPLEKLQSAVDDYNAKAGTVNKMMTLDGEVELPPTMPMTQGPYYAISLKLFHENAIGGVVIDENTAVVRNGKPVPGLYATGDNTRGIMLPGNIGVQYIENTISALTFAFSSGFVAGQEVCKATQGA